MTFALDWHILCDFKDTSKDPAEECSTVLNSHTQDLRVAIQEAVTTGWFIDRRRELCLCPVHAPFLRDQLAIWETNFYAYQSSTKRR